MILGIVGSRKRNKVTDKQIVKDIILKLKPDKIVSGECQYGADRFAKNLAEELGIEYEGFPPDEVPPGSPKWMYTRAFFARNKQIADVSDKLAALVVPERRGGTENTIGHFKKKESFKEEDLYII